MNNPEVLKVGIAGVGRGFCLRDGLESTEKFKVVAATDLNPKQKEAILTMPQFKGIDFFASYDEMIEQADIDAVVIATPDHIHAKHSLMALKKDKHVICEVIAAKTLEEAKELVKVEKASKGTYLVAENSRYIMEIALVIELVNRGLFGETYYAEGEYLHNCIHLLEATPWRRKWGYGVNGNTYSTHELGPVTAWFGERIDSVCCAGSGQRFKDVEGKLFEQEATNITLCKTKSGKLAKIRLDMQSPRPMANPAVALQGTEGCFESSRMPAMSGKNRIWLKSRCKDENEWLDLKELEEEFLPEIYKSEKALEMYKTHHHRGSDFFCAVALAEMLLGTRKITLGIHDALDMTLPGMMSQQSITSGSCWIEVPDSREW